MKRNFLRRIPFLFLAAILFVGCKKYLNPEPRFEEYEQEVDRVVKRKVLVITVDGLVGKEIEKKVPRNIATLMSNAKYSFDGITDVNTSDAASWATLVTGYSAKKHHIVNENYLPEANSDDPHGEVNFVPSLVYRLEEKMPSTRTSVILQDEGLANVLLMDADDNILVDSDEKVKNETISLLQKAAPDFLLVQFKDVLKAGIQHGFSVDQTGYNDALEQVDIYIGDIITFLKERENYPYEDWLIVVSSTHGGVGNSYGGESFQERNVFTLYYQKDFKQMELIPEIIISPQFYGYDGSENGPSNGVRARNLTAAAGEDNYNAAKTGKITIEAKVKTNKNAGGNWSYVFPPFISKTDSRYGSTPGWSFFRGGNNVNFWCGDGGVSLEVSAGPVSINDQWAHITGTIEGDGPNVLIKFYLNGQKVAEKSGLMDINKVLSTSPLTFGFQPYVFSGGFIDTHIADVHIWNTVLSDAEILANAKRMGVDQNHPKISNLVGDWPMNDGGPILHNKVPNMPNIPLQGNYQYKVLGNNFSFIDESAILVQNIDLSTQVFYWLGITPNQNWALEGSVFLSKFEIEFLK